MKYIDLHIHSIYSDGTQTPLQIVRTAKANGLDMISLDDHDTVKGYFEAVPIAKQFGIDLIPGVEISTIEHHLVGKNFGPHNEKFLKFIEKSKDIQKGVCLQRIEILQDYGIPISMKKVEKYFY